MKGTYEFRGKLEARLKPLLDGLKERCGILGGRKIIFAIDNLPSKLMADNPIYGTFMGKMLESFVTHEGISVVGTATDEEYKKYIEDNSDLSCCVQKCSLEDLEDKKLRVSSVSAAKTNKTTKPNL